MKTEGKHKYLHCKHNVSKLISSEVSHACCPLPHYVNFATMFLFVFYHERSFFEIAKTAYRASSTFSGLAAASKYFATPNQTPWCGAAPEHIYTINWVTLSTKKKIGPFIITLMVPQNISMLFQGLYRYNCNPTALHPQKITLRKAPSRI